MIKDSMLCCIICPEELYSHAHFVSTDKVKPQECQSLWSMILFDYSRPVLLSLSLSRLFLPDTEYSHEEDANSSQNHSDKGDDSS